MRYTDTDSPAYPLVGEFLLVAHTNVAKCRKDAKSRNPLIVPKFTLPSTIRVALAQFSRLQSSLPSILSYFRPHLLLIFQYTHGSTFDLLLWW